MWERERKVVGFLSVVVWEEVESWEKSLRSSIVAVPVYLVSG